jgi:APA family basic amino acid/polyamine antiporter
VQVGLIAGSHIFGPTGGKIVGCFICLGLIASVSAMTWVGPRVAATMGEDLAVFRWLTPSNADRVPRAALLLQLVIVTVLIVTSTFEKVLVYIQFALTLCSACAVVGVMILRVRRPDLPRPFRIPLYPLPPLIFLLISGWMLLHVIRDKPQETIAGLATLLAGLILLFLSPKSKVASTSHDSP